MSRRSGSEKELVVLNSGADGKIYFLVVSSHILQVLFLRAQKINTICSCAVCVEVARSFERIVVLRVSYQIWANYVDILFMTLSSLCFHVHGGVKKQIFDAAEG